MYEWSIARTIDTTDRAIGRALGPAVLLRLIVLVAPIDNARGIDIGLIIATPSWRNSPESKMGWA